MSDREWHWQNATGGSTPSDANRLMLEQAERLRQMDERIAKIASLMGVPDGGRYINDWESRAEVVRKSEDTVKALADALERVKSEIRKPKRVWVVYLDSIIHDALRLAGRIP